MSQLRSRLTPCARDDFISNFTSDRRQDFSVVSSARFTICKPEVCSIEKSPFLLGNVGSVEDNLLPLFGGVQIAAIMK